MYVQYSQCTRRNPRAAQPPAVEMASGAVGWRAAPSGFTELDASLPGGWPMGVVCELMPASSGDRGARPAAAGPLAAGPGRSSYRLDRTASSSLRSRPGAAWHTARARSGGTDPGRAGISLGGGTGAALPGCRRRVELARSHHRQECTPPAARRRSRQQPRHPLSTGRSRARALARGNTAAVTTNARWPEPGGGGAKMPRRSRWRVPAAAVAAAAHHPTGDFPCSGCAFAYRSWRVKRGGLSRKRRPRSSPQKICRRNA